MARYKWIDASPRFLAVDLAKQLLPGSFEHAVHHLFEHEIDLGGFAARYRNDQNGAPAYPPGMLLQVILCDYARGVVSSRGIERLCREHVTFIALCGDTPALHDPGRFRLRPGRRSRPAVRPGPLPLRPGRG